MGVSAHISFDQWPKQGTFLNLRAEVCFRYDTERVVMGTIVRNDSEGDGITIIKLDDGRFVLGTECQYRPIYGSAHEPSSCPHCERWKEALVVTEAHRKRLELRCDELEEGRCAEPPADLLREVVDALECRDPSEAHYCPNCDRSLYDITQKVRASLTKSEIPAAAQSAANSGQCESRKAAQSGTAAGASVETDDRQWLIRKRGYYYRPDRAGYTANIADAGRYTEAEAKAEAAIEPSIMQAIHISQAVSENARHD